jgi:hypothetical protein
MIVRTLVAAVILLAVSPAYAQYRVLQRLSLVSVHVELARREPDTLHITNLGHKEALRNCGGVQGNVRVLVLNHGTPVPVFAPENTVSGFVEIYADLDNDDEPDPVPYKALDPFFQDDLWVTWRDGDDLRVVYLRDSGKVVAVEGFRPQIIWRPPLREDSIPLACKTADASKPGGHQALSAYALWRIW